MAVNFRLGEKLWLGQYIENVAGDAELQSAYSYFSGFDSCA